MNASREYATLKALGFGPRFLTGLIYGESLAISLAGALIGIALTFPVADQFSKQMGTLFPVFGVSLETVYMQVAAAIAVGVAAAVLPAAVSLAYPSLRGCAALANSRSKDMSIPFSYTLRNLAARKLTTVLTAGGMALVVFVFATVLMLEEGLRKTLVETGSPDNVVITRRSAGTEVQSQVDREQAAIVENQPEVAYGVTGTRLASKETIVLISLPKRGSDKASNVLIRGVGQKGHRAAARK